MQGLDRSTAGLLPGRRKVWTLAVLSACLAVGGPAWAEDPWEWWPEAQVFVGRTTLTRMFLNLAYARGKDVDAGTLALDAAAYRARDRYLWARIGYDHVFKSEGGEPARADPRRLEVFLARQADSLPSKSALNAVGVVAKCYF